MGRTNANKAQQKRERNAAKSTEGAAASQLKANQQALSVVCTICRQPFICTVQTGELQKHQETKHAGETFAKCFPGRAQS
mmetsp:Transcript_11053/g.18078  ORF Transcript_11053/g.18078 Transcript_11053/m.18078 type:complete len:80 (-) Transcript_11053:267-506(-)